LARPWLRLIITVINYNYSLRKPVLVVLCSFSRSGSSSYYFIIVCGTISAVFWSKIIYYTSYCELWQCFFRQPYWIFQFSSMPELRSWMWLLQSIFVFYMSCVIIFYAPMLSLVMISTLIMSNSVRFYAFPVGYINFFQFSSQLENSKCDCSCLYSCFCWHAPLLLLCDCCFLLWSQW
jgi:hypothetical protein